MYTLTESGITIDQTERGVFMKQDKDIISVCPVDYKEMRDVLTTIVDDTPPPENEMNGIDLRMTLIAARVKRNQLRRDIAYEEGRINVVECLLEK